MHLIYLIVHMKYIRFSCYLVDFMVIFLVIGFFAIFCMCMLETFYICKTNYPNCQPLINLFFIKELLCSHSLESVYYISYFQELLVLY